MTPPDPARLPMWVIYDRPADHPDWAIARLWYSLPAPEPTESILRAEKVSHLRIYFRQCGFTYLARSEGDDPKIVESWML